MERVNFNITYSDSRDAVGTDSILDQFEKHINTKYEKKWGQRVSLSKPTFAGERPARITVEEHIRRIRAQESFDPTNPLVAKTPGVEEIEEKAPVDMIKARSKSIFKRAA